MPLRAAVEKLKRDLLIMSEMCENALDSAVMALVDRDEEIAQQTIAYDHEIDEMELAVDHDCYRLLGETRLTDEDRRFVVAATKINNDLERIGDCAVTVCEHVLFLVRERTLLHEVVDLGSLVEQVEQMMRESVQALVEHDVRLAWKIVDEQLVAHGEMRLIFGEVLDIMQQSPLTIERCCHILAVCMALQRVADLATNVAEEVVFMADGTPVRHHIREHHPVEPEKLQVAASAEEITRHETDIIRKKTDGDGSGKKKARKRKRGK